MELFMPTREKDALTQSKSTLHPSSVARRGEDEDPTMHPRRFSPKSGKSNARKMEFEQSLNTLANGFGAFLQSQPPSREHLLATGGSSKRMHKQSFQVGMTEVPPEKTRVVVRDWKFTKGDLQWESKKRAYAGKSGRTNTITGDTPEAEALEAAKWDGRRKKKEQYHWQNLGTMADLAGASDADPVKQAHRPRGRRTTTPRGGRKLGATIDSGELTPRRMYGKKKHVEGRNPAAESDPALASKKQEQPEYKTGFFSKANVGALGAVLTAQVKPGSKARAWSTSGRRLVSFVEQEQKRMQMEEAALVRELDNWKPSQRRGERVAELELLGGPETLGRPEGTGGAPPAAGARAAADAGDGARMSPRAAAGSADPGKDDPGDHGEHAPGPGKRGKSGAGPKSGARARRGKKAS